MSRISYLNNLIIGCAMAIMPISLGCGYNVNRVLETITQEATVSGISDQLEYLQNNHFKTDMFLTYHTKNRRIDLIGDYNPRYESKQYGVEEEHTNFMLRISKQNDFNLTEENFENYEILIYDNREPLGVIDGYSFHGDALVLDETQEHLIKSKIPIERPLRSSKALRPAQSIYQKAVNFFYLVKQNKSISFPNLEDEINLIHDSHETFVDENSVSP